MILGLTPARGGSKGIPRKNIRMIAGKPLIAWTIETAKDSNLIDKYVVSTEDKEIADISKRYGAEILERPRELAGDKTTTLEVLEHALKHIKCDTIVLLQATSPIRRKGLIDECIKEFVENNYDSLATGFMCKHIEYGKDVELSRDSRELLRQEVGGFFYDDGNVYVIKADILRKRDRYGKKIGRKILSRMENIEIDDEFDIYLAEKILGEGNWWDVLK